MSKASKNTESQDSARDAKIASLEKKIEGLREIVFSIVGDMWAGHAIGEANRDLLWRRLNDLNRL